MTDAAAIKNCFGHNVPSKNLPLPASANLTAVELLTFLPNCLKSADVVYRFVSNGALRSTLWAIVNKNRDLEKEWNVNSCGAWMYKAMRSAGYQKWTVGNHHQWHDAKKDTWNGHDISVIGFKTPCEIAENGTLAKDIPFADLGVDVRNMPAYYDALDLTKMVHYAMNNPDEGWMYPKDYDELLELMGGPQEVKEAHTDIMAFKRWVNVVPPPPRPRLPQPAISANPQNGKRNNEASAETPSNQHRSKKTQTDGTRVEASAGTTQSGNTRSRKTTKPSDAIFAKAEQAPSNPQEREAKRQDSPIHEYVRDPPRWIAPPKVDNSTSDEDFDAIRMLEGDVRESDSFSPYAFVGPRQTAPYRPLDRIGMPHRHDIGGWAENIRWATHQTAWYGSVGWNESPEHMEMIAQIRQEQLWASDEWLEAIREGKIECITGFD